MSKPAKNTDSARNRTQIHRQWTLLMFLSKHPRHSFTLKELAQKLSHFGASERTLRRDLDDLLEFGLPIKSTTERNVNKWSIDQGKEPLRLDTALPFNDFMIFLMLKQQLEQTQLTSFREHLDGWMRQNMIPHGERGQNELNEIDRLVRVTRKLPIKYESKAEVLDEIYTALREEEVLKLTFQAMNKDPEVRTVDPLGLWFADGAIYLVAYCRTREKTRHFSLQRIISAQRDHELSYYSPPGFSMDEYVKLGIGAFHGEQAQEVLLHYSAEAASYARERSFHPSQELEDGPDGTLYVRMRIHGLKELAAHIASFGGQIVPLSPPELHDKVQKIYLDGLKALKQHHPIQSTTGGETSPLAEIAQA